MMLMFRRRHLKGAFVFSLFPHLTILRMFLFPPPPPPVFILCIKASTTPLTMLKLECVTGGPSCFLLGMGMRRITGGNVVKLRSKSMFRDYFLKGGEQHCSQCRATPRAALLCAEGADRQM